MNSLGILSNKKSLFNFFGLCYFASVFLLYVSGVVFFAVIPFLCFILVFCDRQLKLSLVFVLLFFSILILFNHAFWEQKFYPQLYFFACSLTAGYVISQSDNKYAPLLFFICGLYFFHKISTGSNLNEDVFAANSRNWISIFTITLSMYVFYSKVNRYIKLFCFIMSFVLSVLSFGRMGIITSLLMLFVYILTLIEFKTLKGRIELLLTIILLLFFLVLGFHEYEEQISFAYNRFVEHGTSDSHRGEVINCYLERMDLRVLIFGLNSFGNDYCGSLAIGTYSPHNSLIYLLSNSGFLSILIFTPMFVSIVMGINRMESIIVFLFLLRSITDNMLFYTFFDAIYWAFVFRILSHLKIKFTKE